jgi:hypothetical protein
VNGRHIRLRVFKVTIGEPRFERIWLQSRKRFLRHVAQKPGNIGLRSQPVVYKVGRKKHVAVGAKRITVEQLRKVLGLESVKDLSGTSSCKGGSSGRCLLRTSRSSIRRSVPVVPQAPGTGLGKGGSSGFTRGGTKSLGFPLTSFSQPYYGYNFPIIWRTSSLLFPSFF